MMKAIMDNAMTATEVEQLVRDFEDCKLPLAEWHHAQHLIVSMFYLDTMPEGEAMARIRVGIQLYNKCQGIITTKERGYHETLTRFWIEVIKRFLVARHARIPLGELAAELTATYTDKFLPLKYYSRDLLNSEDARRYWLEPDLQPLGDEV